MTDYECPTCGEADPFRCECPTDAPFIGPTLPATITPPLPAMIIFSEARGHHRCCFVNGFTRETGELRAWVRLYGSDGFTAERATMLIFGE